MSVLKGEGTHPILFGSTSIAVGTRIQGGYLARPDLTGEWPTIVVVASEWGVTSSTKDLCRKMARRGFAAIAPDLYRGRAPQRSAGASEAVFTFGHFDAGNDWWWAVDNILVAGTAAILHGVTPMLRKR